MNLPKLLSDFQARFDSKSAVLTHFLGVYYADWDHYKQLVINIAEKLCDIESPRVLPECLYILMHHEIKPRIWDAGSFVLFLNYIDKELTKMFFYIIHGIIGHPFFGPYCEHNKQNYCLSELGYRPIHTRDFSGKLVYNGFEFYDSLVEINAYFMGYIPVHLQMPFFQSRLHLCDLDVARFRDSSLKQRQKMLLISGISSLLIRRFFAFTRYQISKQMKMVLTRNFSA